VNVFGVHKRRYGTRRLQVALREKGHRVGRQRLRAAMRRRGWHVAATMPEELVTMALQRAFLAQPPTPQLVVHFDRGGQYCGNAYRQLLHDHEAVRSQSRRGDCYDNAQAENRLKVLGASGRASKRRCLNYANGLFSPTWPVPKRASPTILTTTITSACTRVFAIRHLIVLTINLFKLQP
jgi:transposase InsO family protein